MNSDIEATELAIAETKLETEKFKGQGVSTDTQRKRVLKELEEKLEKTTAAADAYERKHQAASKTIGQLKTGISSVHKSNRRGGSAAAASGLHAIDATPARWRGCACSSPLDGVSTAAFSPRNG